jgi:hypothetical protein
MNMSRIWDQVPGIEWRRIDFRAAPSRPHPVPILWAKRFLYPFRLNSMGSFRSRGHQTLRPSRALGEDKAKFTPRQQRRLAHSAGTEH